MPDLDVQIRTYIDSVSEPLTAEEVLAAPVGEGYVRPLSPGQTAPGWWRGWRWRRAWIAVATAVVTLVVVGGVAVLLRSSPEPADRPDTSTTVPSTTATTVAPTSTTAVASSTTLPPVEDDRLPSSLVNEGTVIGRLAASPFGLFGISELWRDGEVVRLTDESTWATVDGVSIPPVDVAGSDLGLVVTGEVPGMVFCDEPCAVTPISIWYSADGRVWEEVPSNALPEFVVEPFEPSDDLSGEVRALSLTASDIGFVVVGVRESSSGPASTRSGWIWFSSDGRTWQHVYSPEGSTSVVWDVTYSPSGFYAVGELDDEAAVWRSVDGIEWQLVHSGPALLGLTAVAASEHGVIASGPGDGASEMLWFSPDGESWIARDFTQPLPDGTRLLFLEEVAASSEGYVVVGNFTWDGRHGAGRIVGDYLEPTVPAMWFSEDGITWIQVHLELSPDRAEELVVVASVRAFEESFIASGTHTWMFTPGDPE